MRLTAVAVAALVATLAVPVVAASPAQAEPLRCEGFDEDTTEVGNTPDPSVPYDLLGVERATEILAERGRLPGQGVNVAVIDSGVGAPDVGLAPLSVVRPEGFSVIDGEKPVFEHGTNVAGLVAAGEREDGGPTGIAPASVIYDLRVYKESDDAGFGGVDPDDVAAALDWLSVNAEDEQIGVAVLALSLPDTPALKRAVARLSREDVVIVAGSGNRPEEGQDGYQDFGEQTPGENAAGTVFPAAYADDVFAVTSTAGGIPAAEGELPDASGLVLRSADIDAAVPTFGAVTLASNGSTCVVEGIATSWAAGVAGGVVALVRSAYPQENADQIEARLKASASGSATTPNTTTGHGVLQPVEALTQQLDPTRDGVVDDMPSVDVPQPRITAPAAEINPLTATLGDARWWGLFGGAALVIALLVRPLLRRCHA